jgi:hypothetical protein
MGIEESMLEERSSLIRLKHLPTVESSADLMLVPARMRSLRVDGSLMNSLIWSSSSSW